MQNSFEKSTISEHDATSRGHQTKGDRLQSAWENAMIAAEDSREQNQGHRRRPTDSSLWNTQEKPTDRKAHSQVCQFANHRQPPSNCIENTTDVHGQSHDRNGPGAAFALILTLPLTDRGHGLPNKWNSLLLAAIFEIFL